MCQFPKSENGDARPADDDMEDGMAIREPKPMPFMEGVISGRAAFARGLARCGSDDPAIADWKATQSHHLVRQGWLKGSDAACVAAHSKAPQTCSDYAQDQT